MKANKSNAPLFEESDFEEMRKLGISEEEIETLKNAATIKATADMLPAEKDLAKFMANVKNQFSGKDPGKEITEFFELAEKNPEYFLQIFALFEVLDIHDNEGVAPAAAVEKISTDAIETEEKEQLKESVKDFLAVYNTLSEEEKKLLIEKIKNDR